MKVSFVMLYHPERLDNLRQTLRFIHRREPELLDQELILVCQTECLAVASEFRNTRQINMRLETYHKSFMTNTGAKAAHGDVLVLLDSDRILPHGFFTKVTSEIQPKQVITAHRLYRLEKDYTDEEIEKGQVIKHPEFKSKSNAGRQKNLFAGTTVMLREEYLEIGGYDEEFVGYGFSDSDITMNVMKNDFGVIWLDEEELHLQHNHAMCWKSQMIHRETFKIVTATNALRYCTKWNVPRDKGVHELLEEVEAKIDTFPQDLKEQYLEMKQKHLMSQKRLLLL